MAERRLSLDHITVTDTTPWQLAQIAAQVGCAGICPFLHSMEVLPAMPAYDLVRDPQALRQTRAALAATGVTVDLVYPFTMAGRTNPADFIPALEAGAALGAPLANVLCYDRDPIRRTEKLVELAELAAPFDIALAIEFYPPSQVQTLSAALDEIARSGRSDIKVTADLLHIMRGPEPDTSFPLLAHPAIAIAQIADGPTTIDPDQIEREAGIQRQLPGQGTFNIPAFVNALNPNTPLSVEIPQQNAIDKGSNAHQRAKWAVDCVKEVVKRTH
ncbi:sugar phosphate isomerase/epimerase family protein [Sphingobium chungangianum]